MVRDTFNTLAQALSLKPNLSMANSKSLWLASSIWLAMGRDSRQAAYPFKLLKMFIKGKAAFQFERPHDGEACAVSKTEILVGVSFENGESRVLSRTSYRNNFNKTAFLKALPEENSDRM